MEIKSFKTIVPGTASGVACVSSLPISFYGGVDPETGKIRDIYNELQGEYLQGKILCMPGSKGSCSGSAVVLELIRKGLCPAGILCLEAEPILTLGAIIGKKIYHRAMPILTIQKEHYDKIHSGDSIEIKEDGVYVNDGS